MQNRSAHATPVLYRERLSPSLWIIASAGVCAPMAALVVVPLDTTVALVVGLAVAAAIIVAIVAGSPRLEVTADTLRAGRAQVPLWALGEPVTLTGSEAREARGPRLDIRSWHLIRGGIDGLVVIPIEDPSDPTPALVISTRTPDRLRAAISRSRERSRGPDAQSEPTGSTDVR